MQIAKDADFEDDLEDDDDYESPRKRSRSSTSSRVSVTGGGDGAELLHGPLDCRPIYNISVWQEPGAMTQRCSVACVLPSGVEDSGFTTQIVDDGEFVQLTFTWPRLILDMRKLHDHQMKQDHSFRLYHPKVIGFEEGLKSLRAHVSDSIVSTCRIPMPFPVCDMTRELIGDKSGSRIVYLELKGAQEDYSVVQSRGSFTIVD